jgi:23S rRNA pseudouridine1911/1915/1917 synthase
MGAVGSNPLEPGLIHRLDNGTSGLLVAAKSQLAFDALKSALAQGAIDKQYLAVVVDNELPEEGRIDVALEPSPHNPRRVIAARSRSGSAREAQTTFVVIERQPGLALVSATARRALRHQIRAHFASIACPLANDEAYGGPRVDALAKGRHALHARRVTWGGNQVISGFDVVADVPTDLEVWLAHSGFRLVRSIE